MDFTMSGNAELLHTFNGVIRGAIGVEEALPVLLHHKRDAEQDMAFAIQDASAQLMHPSRANISEGVRRLAELAWRLYGPVACVEKMILISLADTNVGVTFFKEKLLTSPDVFTEAMLGIVCREFETLTPLVEQVRTERIRRKSAALQKQPRELQEDAQEVRRYVSLYSFNSELNDLLLKVESEITAGGDSFDQSATLKHVRTFYEKLHQSVGETLRSKRPEITDRTDLSSCGQAIDFLTRRGVLKEKMRDLAKSLYGVLSNEGVHAIKSEREYVRLCRNMVCEYALVLFYELERRLSAP
jgi:hypothetical protein